MAVPGRGAGALSHSDSPLWAGLLVLALSLAVTAAVLAIWNAVMIVRLAPRASYGWLVVNALVALLLFFPCALSSLVSAFGRWVELEEWSYGAWLLLYPSAALIQWRYLRWCLDR